MLHYHRRSKSFYIMGCVLLWFQTLTGTCELAIFMISGVQLFSQTYIKTHVLWQVFRWECIVNRLIRTDILVLYTFFNRIFRYIIQLFGMFIE